MPYVITEGCVDVQDKTCINECPVDCIYEGKRMLYINPEQCVDCGACEPVCPVEAIYFDADLPSEYAIYAEGSAEVFQSGEAMRQSRLPLSSRTPIDDPEYVRVLRLRS